MTKRKNFIAIFMSLAMTLIGFIPTNTAFAADNDVSVPESTTINLADLPVEEKPSEFVFPSAEELKELEKLETSIATTSSQTLGAGRHYLGHFKFTNTNTGLTRTYNGSRMRLCIAWKSADTGGDVDLEVTVHNSTGYTWKKYRCSEDSNGKDSDDYYYVIGPWMQINNWNRDRYIYYDAVTREGYTAPGYYRSADVHTWVDIE